MMILERRQRERAATKAFHASEIYRTLIRTRPKAHHMLKNFQILVALLLIAPFAFGQSPTPTPALEPAPAPTVSALEPTPLPTIKPAAKERDAVASSSSFSWSEEGAPVFTADKAVLTALQQNPDILRAKEEIERTKGVVIEIRAQALPHITPQATYQWTDPNLRSNSFSQSSAAALPTATPGSNLQQTDKSYRISVLGTQLVFSFRSVVDQVIATVKTQFYQVIVNRALIGVQEESVRLLESQLKDQENRFEAGTVPRFNVLQAQVQLSNQIPNLIAARNSYRISILQLAKTLGLEYDPSRGVASPLRAVGELAYVPRRIDLLEAIEEGKRHRPFLKQSRANVLNQIEQVHVAIGGFLPTVNIIGGGEFISSPVNSSFNDISKGWTFQMVGSWPIWDSGQVYGQVKQQRALLSETKITYDDDVRQVELEIQQAASNLLQNRELIQATEKNVEQADEAVRLAKARLDAGAGTQLDVLNAQVQLTTAQSTRLQALFGYISSLAEFDRVTGTESNYTESFNGMATRAAKSKVYDTSSDTNASGERRVRGGSR